MAKITDPMIKQIIEEINAEAEKTRRAYAKRRLDIFRDGGRAFLIEQVKREFGSEALPEMRLAPINLLKKIVTKRAQLYKRAPSRICPLESDQKLVDYYTQELGVNEVFQKANRYHSLLANTLVYTFPVGDKLKSVVVPSHLYSLVPDPLDQTKIEAVVFNAFLESGQILETKDVPSASGEQGFNRDPGYKTSKDRVASGEKDSQEQERNYIVWSSEDHFTTDSKGNRLILDPNKEPSQQFVNPIDRLPVVNLTKDRDNEVWATQGEDMVDLTLAIQLGWTDLLTIAKHQGFSILTVVSEEEPKKLTIGVSKAVWLKQNPTGPTPSISYVQGSSPLSEYKELLMELLALLLTSNDMDPAAVGGIANTRNFTSGFHALISMADNLDAIEMDKPVFKAGEREYWEIVKAWHNYLHDLGALNPEAKALGKFSDQFQIEVRFSDVKPLESEQERLTIVKDQMGLGLMTKEDAIRRLYPDLDQKQIDQKLAKIEEELAKARERFEASIQGGEFNPGASDPLAEDEGGGDSENGEKDAGTRIESRPKRGGGTERVLVSNKTGKVIRVLD